MVVSAEKEEAQEKEHLMKRKYFKKIEKSIPKKALSFEDPLEWLGWDEDSIYQKFYLDDIERDLSLGFPRYRRRSN